MRCRSLHEVTETKRPGRELIPRCSRIATQASTHSGPFPFRVPFGIYLDEPSARWSPAALTLLPGVPRLVLHVGCEMPLVRLCSKSELPAEGHATEITISGHTI